MSVALTLTSQDFTQDNVVAYGTVALTGTYPTNGDAVDFGTLGIQSNEPPIRVEFFELTPSPGPQSGYAFVFLPGTGQAGLIELFNGTTQATTATYASLITVSGFVLGFRATFPSNI